MARHCGSIVCEEDPARLSRPLEYGWIVCTRQVRVRKPHYVYGQVSPEQAANDDVVEVLVRGEAEQPLLLPVAGASHQPVSDS